VIVTACVHRGQSEPFISLCIVNLSLFACTVDVLSGPCDNDKVFSYRAARVSMAGILHPCLLIKLEVGLVAGNGHNFVHLEHALGKLIKVTSSDYKHSGLTEANLDCLEIVREVHGCLNCVQGDLLCLSIVNVELP